MSDGLFPAIRTARAPPRAGKAELTLDPLVLLLLAGVGALAGFVDAIAGGGGLLALPALLSAGLPPVAAFATNKFQGSVGTTIAAITYWRRGYADLRSLLPAIAATAVGSLLGAIMVKRIDTGVLSVAVPVALIALAVYFVFAPKVTDQDSAARLPLLPFLPLLTLGLGFYDGVFGPGTGSFLTLGFVALFGFGVTRAAGSTKVVNLVSNLAALFFFIASDDVVWPAAIAMAIGQVSGGYLGALTGIRFGVKLIRPMVIIISVALALRLLLVP